MLPNKIAARLCAVTVALIAWDFLPSFPADAATPRPCAEELGKYCKDVPSGEGRLVKCLKEHEADLSTVCRENLGKVCKRVEECKLACSDDITKYCLDVKEGRGRIARCLKEHAAELSPRCRETLHSARQFPGGQPPQGKP